MKSVFVLIIKIVSCQAKKLTIMSSPVLPLSLNMIDYAIKSRSTAENTFWEGELMQQKAGLTPLFISEIAQLASVAWPQAHHRKICQPLSVRWIGDHGIGAAIRFCVLLFF